jgi:hypothetical protein
MKKIMLFFHSVLYILLINTGVSTDTIVITSNGHQEIGLLKVGDKIICLNHNLMTEEKSVISIEEIEADKVVEITTEDGTIIFVAAAQQIFVPNKWLRADQLSLGDILLKEDRSFIGITGIRHKYEPTKLRFIVVEDYHNFLVSKNGILIHNGAVGAAVGVAVGASTVAGAYGSITGVIYTFGGPAAGSIWTLWTAAPAMTLSKTVGLACGIALGTVTGPI